MPHCAPVRRVTLPAALGPAATFWLTTAVWLTIAVWLAAAAPAVALDLDRPAERTLAVGETHSYRLGSVTGPFRLIAEQLGIDLAIEIIARDGSILATFDGPVDRWGVETLWFDERLWVDERQWIDNAPSPQRIDVRASRPRAAPGRYRLTLEPAEGPLDASRREAERATTTAARLAAERTVDGWRAARVHARQARILWQELDAPRRLARTVHALAALHQQLGEVDAAAELFDEAARRWQSLGDDGEARTLRALALGELGVARIERGELDQARQALHQALTRNLEEGRRFEAAGNRMDLGLAAHRQGDLHEARGLYRQALATYRELGDLTFEAILLSNLGGVALQLGEAGPALEHFERALELHRAAGDQRETTNVLNNLAALSRSIGEPERALELYRQVLALTEATGDRRAHGRALNNLGYAYLQLGELERARGFFERALAVRRQLGDRRGEAVALNNLGTVHDHLGELPQAIDAHRRSLALRHQLGDRYGEISLLTTLGRELADQFANPSAKQSESDASASRDAFARAAQLLEGFDHPPAAARLDALRAHAALTLGDVDGARQAAERAAAVRRQIGDRSGEAEALVVWAQAERAAGRPAAAQQRLDQALEILETLRARIVHPDLRAAYLAARRDAWELRVELLMDRHAEDPEAGWELAAFEASERLRARTLRDLLAEAGAERGLDPDLAKQQRELVRRLSLAVGRLTGRRQPADRDALNAQIARLRAELDVLEGRIRRQQPGWAERQRPRPVAARELQRRLASDSLLLTTLLGKERSFAWALTRETTTVYELPARAELERSARASHELWSTLATGDRGRQRLEAAALTERILQPIATQLASDHLRRLIVVADGALTYVPFAALPFPSTPASSPGARYSERSRERLVGRLEVIHLPAAALLAPAPAREPASNGDLASSGQPTLTVLADPVFATPDPEAPVLLPLPATRREAAAIETAAPVGSVRRITGHDARRDAVMSGLLETSRYVHFATHGWVDDRHPRLSALALARSDARGQPLDGMLRLNDIFQLELDAELVVLSGCRTALGREIRGEGLVGLTRAFFTAGARQVIASLWPVDDRATAELMGHFYRALLIEGAPPAAALATAQRNLTRDRQWRDPYYWAAFIVLGDTP